MTNPTPTPNNEQRPAIAKNPVIWLVAAAAGLLLMILVVVAISRPAAPPLVGATPTAAIVPDVVMDNSEAERRALAKTQLLRLQQDGDDIRRLLMECEQELASWAREIEPELTGKRGMAIAANQESLTRFSAVYRQPRTTQTELDACRSRVEALLEPVRSAIAAQTLYIPSEGTVQELASERRFAQAAQQSLREVRQNALAVLFTAEGSTASGTRTLTEALTDLEKHQADRRAREVTARQEEARRQATADIAEAHAEREMEYGRAESDAIREETRRELERLKAEGALKGQKAAHDLLEARAADPAVQALYAPFLGKAKFGSPNNVPGLISFNFMTEIGALQSVDNFVNAACGRNVSVGSAVHPYFRDNDRSRWPYPATEQDWDEYARRFAEFRELAPHFIKLNLLRK